MRSEYNAFEICTVFEHFLARIAQFGKVDGGKPGAALESGFADGITLVKVERSKRSASVKCVFTYYFHISEVDFFQLGVAGEGIFAQVFYFAFEFYLFQSGAIVESIFSDFFHRIGNYYLFNGAVGCGNFVCVVVVFVHFDGVVGGVQTERIRPDVQHSFLFGDFDYSVLDISFIGHKHVVFDYKRILNVYSETRFYVGAGKRSGNGYRAFLHRGYGTVLIYFCDSFVAGLIRHFIFAGNVPRIHVAGKLNSFARIHFNRPGNSGDEFSFTRFSYFAGAGSSAVCKQSIEISKAQRFYRSVVCVAHSVIGHNGDFSLRSGGFTSYNSFFGLSGKTLRCGCSLLDVDYYHCRMRRERSL